MKTKERMSLSGFSFRALTLGCKLNFAETSTLCDMLKAEGVHEAAKGEPADIIIINTCSVTAEADQKCRQGIRRLVRQNPGACVAVTGCYAQLKPDEVQSIEGVTYVLSQRDKGEVVATIRRHFLNANADVPAPAPACPAPVPDLPALSPGSSVATAWPFFPSCSHGERTRYFLKVQDGCNYFCTYCTIPFARGRSRNAPIASLVAQAEEAARQGGREIVITGVNIGDFGRSTGETFFQLVQALDRVEGIARYRISSIEPNLLTDEIIDFCAGSRAFMPHFHIPLQCGSDAVLRLMHRRYDTALFRHKIERIKSAMPHAFIGVDVIVGARGETDDLFRESRDFIASLPVQQLHVFPYSERAGTRALEIPHVVSPAEKHARSQELIALSEEKRLAFYRQHIGQTRTVLWENGAGWTDNYIRVMGACEPNSLSSVTLGPLAPDGESLLAL